MPHAGRNKLLEYAEARNNLGFALAGRGQLDEAIEQFQQAVEIRPDYAEAQKNFGLALGRSGRRNEALAQYQEALALASASNDKALAETVRARIRLLKAAAAGNLP